MASQAAAAPPKRHRAEPGAKPASASTPPLHRALCDSVSVLIDDASAFGLAERGLWHHMNLGSALPRKLWRERDGIAILAASTAQPPPASTHGVQLRMGPATATHFLYAAYRLVLAVDISPSLFALDSHSGRVPFADALAGVATVARALVAPMQCAPADRDLPAFYPHHHQPGTGDAAAATSVWFQPQLHVSVVAQAAAATATASGDGATDVEPFVLLHGFALTSESVDEFIARVSAGLRAVESRVASRRARLGEPQGSSTPPSVGPLLETSSAMLKLLPPHACPAVLLVTDGLETTQNRFNS